jgi:hypothetical protein
MGTSVSPWFTGNFNYAENQHCKSLGRAVQVAPIKPTLKLPGTKRLKPICVDPLSNFAFKFNLRRYTSGRTGGSSATFSPRTSPCAIARSR